MVSVKLSKHQSIKTSALVITLDNGNFTYSTDFGSSKTFEVDVIVH